MGSLSGERSTTAGPDRRLRGVVPYFLSLPLAWASGLGSRSLRATCLGRALERRVL